jgi:tetratricopeptide (TPR) repeat protein/uncharacterized membrane protein YgcG
MTQTNIKRVNWRLPLGIVALLLAGVTTQFAQTQNQFPARNGYVNDFAGVVDDKTKTQLGNLLENLRQKVGIDFAVVTVQTTAGREIFEISRQLAADWNLGARSTSNKSLLLVLAVNEKESFTQFSRSVQNDLPEGVLGEVSQRVKVRLNGGDVSGGLSAGVHHFVSAMAQKLSMNVADFETPTQVAADKTSDQEETVTKPPSAPLAVRPRVASAPSNANPDAEPTRTPEQAAAVVPKPVTVSASTAVKPPAKKSEPAPAPIKPEKSTATPQPASGDKTPASADKTAAARTPEQIAEDDADESEEVELTLTLPLEPRIVKLKEFLVDFPDSKSKPRAIELLVSAYAGLGDQKLKKGETAAGLEQLKLAVESAPADMSEKLFSGVIAQIPLNLFLRGERATAAEFAHSLETRFGSDAKRLVALSNFYVTTEQATEAVRISTQAVTLAPEIADTHQALALALHISLRLDEALAEYKRALELDPNSKTARRGVADLSRALGKSEEALALYRQMLAADATDKPARAGLIFSQMDLGRTAEAKTELDAALKADPKSLPLLAGAAYWFAAHNDIAQANDFGRRALEVEPRYTWSHVAMARAFVAQRKPLNAERALRYARQYGKFPTLDYELASALVAAGLFGEAADVLAESFDWRDGQIETRLGGRNIAKAAGFIELLAPERRASIFQFSPADNEASAKVLKDLLVFDVLSTEDQRGGALNEQNIVTAAKEFASGSDPALVHRQLYAASKLLEKGLGLATAHELAEAARSSADAGLTVPEATLAIQADEYRDIRARAIAAGGTPDVVQAPLNILSNLLRGRIEDISGWALFKQDKVEESLDHLRRAANILPERTPIWRTSVWHLGAALDRLDKREEALVNYIKSYNVGDPDPARRTVIERLYRSIHGSLTGLEEQIQSGGLAPATGSNAEQAQPAPSETPSASIPPPAPVEPAPAPVSKPVTERPRVKPSRAEAAVVESINPPAPSVVTIKGNITDQTRVPIANVVVVLISPQGTVLASTTDDKGNYSFSVAPSNNNYRVIPSKDGFKFEPVDRLLPGVSENQKEMNFTGALKPAP